MKFNQKNTNLNIGISSTTTTNRFNKNVLHWKFAIGKSFANLLLATDEDALHPTSTTIRRLAPGRARREHRRALAVGGA
jgi:hypothetical protein